MEAKKCLNSDNSLAFTVFTLTKNLFEISPKSSVGFEWGQSEENNDTDLLIF